MQSDDTNVDDALKFYACSLEIIKQLEAYLVAAENSVRELKVSLSE